MTVCFQNFYQFLVQRKTGLGYRAEFKLHFTLAFSQDIQSRNQDLTQLLIKCKDLFFVSRQDKCSQTLFILHSIIAGYSCFIYKHKWQIILTCNRNFLTNFKIFDFDPFSRAGQIWMFISGFDLFSIACGQFKNSLISHVHSLFHPAPNKFSGFLIQCQNFIIHINIFHRDIFIFPLTIFLFAPTPDQSS